MRGTHCALLAVALLALACATGEDPDTETDAAADPNQPTRLYVYRPEKGKNTPDRALPVAIDGRPLTALGRDQFVSVRLEGQHQIAVPGERVGIVLRPGRSTYCRVSPVPNTAILAWKIRCGTDPDTHGDIVSCTRALLDRTVDWQK